MCVCTRALWRRVLVQVRAEEVAEQPACLPAHFLKDFSMFISLSLSAAAGAPVASVSVIQIRSKQE